MMTEITKNAHNGFQAAKDGAKDQHFANLDVDRKGGQVMAEWCEGVAILLTGADLPQQTDSVAHGLLLRRIDSSTQEILWRTIFTLLFTHTER